MCLFIDEFLDGRIEEIAQNLSKTNGEYALALDKCSELMETIDPIIEGDADIKISGSDCLCFRDLIEEKFIASSLIQKELYIQGYIDCVKLFKFLKII